MFHSLQKPSQVCRQSISYRFHTDFIQIFEYLYNNYFNNEEDKTTRILAIEDDDIDSEVTDEDQDQGVPVEPKNTTFSNYEDTLFDYNDEEDVTNGLE